MCYSFRDGRGYLVQVWIEEAHLLDNRRFAQRLIPDAKTGLPTTRERLGGRLVAAPPRPKPIQRPPRPPRPPEAPSKPAPGF